MPTISQLEEWVRAKKAKYGPDAHCSQPFVSEELRREAIANKPDAAGKRKTRIALETYSPEAYSAWNELIEELMERCGCNPLLVVDLLALLVHEALRTELAEGMDGIGVALHGLFKLKDYEEELRRWKVEKRLRRLPPKP